LRKDGRWLIQLWEISGRVQSVTNYYKTSIKEGNNWSNKGNEEGEGCLSR
jgi:hypothetical protein